MRVFGLFLGATLLAVSVAFAGSNGGVVAALHVSGSDGVQGVWAKQDEGILEVRVSAAGCAEVNAVHADVEYDPAGLRFEGFRAGDLFADPFLLGPIVREDRHVVDMTSASTSGAVSGEGTMGVFRFRVLDPDRASVRLVSFQTADGSWGVDTQVSYANAVSPTSVPARTRLLGNFPNPFNPVTEIRFDLSSRTVVELGVYNVSGQRVRGLLSGARSAGTHAVVWDGRDESGTPVSSGVYFYRLSAGKYTEAKRMTLVR